MREHSLPPPAYLHKRLRYVPATGMLYWRECAEMPNNWNARYAGKPALTCVGSRYPHGTIDGRTYYAHCVIWAMVTGKWPLEVDHEDHDPLNNRIRNLRKATHLQNARNQSMNAANTSGVMGVRRKRTNRWMARLGSTYIGTFKTFDEAVAARRAAEVEHGFHPNHGQ